MTLLNEPTLQEVKEWLKLDDTIDDVTLADGLLAALDYQRHLSKMPVEGVYPDSLRLAVFLRTARYLARRNSPEGIVGFGEFGPAQIATIDRDIREIEAPFIGPRVA